MIYKENIVYID